jgi:hypothetical protein
VDERLDQRTMIEDFLVAMRELGLEVGVGVWNEPVLDQTKGRVWSGGGQVVYVQGGSQWFFRRDGSFLGYRKDNWSRVEYGKALGKQEVDKT